MLARRICQMHEHVHDVNGSNQSLRSVTCDDESTMYTPPVCNTARLAGLAGIGTRCCCSTKFDQPEPMIAFGGGHDERQRFAVG